VGPPAVRDRYVSVTVLSTLLVITCGIVCMSYRSRGLALTALCLMCLLLCRRPVDQLLVGCCCVIR
jgi:hypothetical protein